MNCASLYETETKSSGVFALSSLLEKILFEILFEKY